MNFETKAIIITIILTIIIMLVIPINSRAITLDEAGVESVESIKKEPKTYDFSVEYMLNNSYYPWEELPTNEVEYKEYIYFKESGFGGELSLYDSVHVQNEDSGAYGICQIVAGDDKPYIWGYGDVINNADSQDYLCTRYMHEAYGSWGEAYEYWKVNESW